VLDTVYLSLSPASGRSLNGQLRDCLEQLAAACGGGLSAARRVLKLTVFIHSRSGADFLAGRARVAAALKKLFQGNPPPSSVVAQSPEEGLDVALYAEALPPESGEAVLAYRLLEGLRYGAVQYPDYKEIFGAGLTADLRFRGTPARSAESFRLMARILETEQMSVGNVVRQWNYIEGLLRRGTSASGSRQTYQDFNDARRRFYGGGRFSAGYPAATGIGQARGGVLVEFQAVSPGGAFQTVPLSNPLQVDAHRYSQNVLVGGKGRAGRLKAPPLFERGKFVGRAGSGVVFVSGTAAVRGETTSPHGDVESQTRITIANILSLISPGNLNRHGVETDRTPGPLAYLRGYVKRRRDAPAVRKICSELLGAVPSNFVRADICRDDLLVELEGVVPVGLRAKKREKGDLS